MVVDIIAEQTTEAAKDGRTKRGREGERKGGRAGGRMRGTLRAKEGEGGKQSRCGLKIAFAQHLVYCPCNSFFSCAHIAAVINIVITIIIIVIIIIIIIAINIHD